MPIEFRCDKCEHLLRTGDEAAGKKARCPECGNIQAVPATGGAALEATAEPLPSDHTPDPLQSPASAQTPSTSQPSAPVAPQYNPFAEAPGGQHTLPQASPTRSTSAALAKAKVMGPAIALIVVSVLGIMLWGLAILGFIISIAENQQEEGTVPGLVMVAISIVVALIVIFGSAQMIRLKSYPLAFTAAILSVAPCSCQWCLSLPFAIWALIVLADSNVKSQFS